MSKESLEQLPDLLDAIAAKRAHGHDLSESQCNTLLVLIIKFSDISNAAKPWPQALNWMTRLSDEFCEQGDVERRRGRQPPPHMDRACAVPAELSRDFVSSILRPFFNDLVAPLMPLSCATRIRELMESNADTMTRLLSESATNVNIKPVE